MEVAEHIAALRGHGAHLADAAAVAGLDAPVPTCPEWAVRELVHHIGGVHRWAADVVGAARTQFRDEPLELVAGGWPADDATIQWFRDGHAALVAALDGAPADLDCVTFLPAPSPLAFWARRQAHETAIHRLDAERAAGLITTFEPTFAADGLDELLTGLAPRPRRHTATDGPVTLALQTSDAGRGWRVTIDPVGVAAEAQPTELDASDLLITGTADELYQLMWNRRSLDGLDVRGDPALLDVWSATISVRWTD